MAHAVPMTRDSPVAGSPSTRKRPVQRAHRPHDLGPRIELRGRWWTIDLRPFGGARYTAVRDPGAAGWPARGDRTDEEAIANRWKWAYVDRLDDDRRREHRGLRRRGRLLGDEIEAFFVNREDQRVAYCTRRSEGTALRAHLLRKLGATANVETVEVGPVRRCSMIYPAPATVQAAFTCTRTQ